MHVLVPANTTCVVDPHGVPNPESVNVVALLVHGVVGVAPTAGDPQTVIPALGTVIIMFPENTLVPMVQAISSLRAPWAKVTTADSSRHTNASVWKYFFI
jgi:hypothetical protein